MPPSWFRFRLRTLFVLVAVVAVWLSWELRYVQQRQAKLAWMRAHQGRVWLMSDWERMSLSQRLETGDPTSIPPWRDWMGDEAVVLIWLPFGQSDEDIPAWQKLFPEARILASGW